LTDIGFLAGGCQQGFLRIWIGFLVLDFLWLFLDLDQGFSGSWMLAFSGSGFPGFQ